MPSGRFATHVHSEWSDDASWTLPDLRDAFRRRGYDGALLCEHDRGFTADRWDAYREECSRFSTAGFLLVPGIEYGDADNVVHTPTWGNLPFFGEGKGSRELLQQVKESGGLAVLAHPWRRDAWQRFEPEWADLLIGLEVWNRKYDGIAPDARAVDMARRHELAEFVSLDFHTSRQFFPLATRLDLADLSVAAVLDSLRQGCWKPEFFSRSALQFSGGLEGTLLRALERGRRSARNLIRS